jgi:hypothetical protein
MLVCGVNTFVFSSTPQYSNHVNLSGGRPSFGKSDPQWGEYDLWHTYVGRMSELLTSGTARAATALYLDAHNFWLGTRESEYAVFNAVEYSELLRRHQRDFDYIDDESIIDAVLKKGQLHIGSAVYDQLVIPEKNRMGAAAKAKVSQLKQQGFPVLTPDESDQITPTLEVAPATWKLLVHKRVYPGGKVGYFVLNTSDTTVKATLRAAESTQPVAVANRIWRCSMP